MKNAIISRTKPRRPPLSLALVLLAAILTVGCGPKAQFVLLPDPDGHVGKGSVAGEGGEQILDEAGESTGLNRSTQAPSDPKILTQEDIRKTYGEALDAAPERPVTYLLYFKSGATELTAESAALLPKIQATIKARNSNDISVVGHTDRVGAADLNKKLSLQRAESIAEWMAASGGVNRNFIEVTSHGEENPIIPTEDDTAEPKNRRVEVTIR
ncbi:MAG: OmpA family protein [Pseudomonadota bacterium]